MAVTISMVALDSTAKLSGTAIAKAWTARWPHSPQPKDLGKKDNTLSCRVGAYQVFYGLMPAPIPWSDLEAPCATAIFWPDATAEMKQHKRHVIVTVMGNANLVEQMKVLTQATIALVDACDGPIGVYWCHSSLVLPPKKFSEIASRFLPDSLPLPIWVNFRIAMNADGTTAGFTRGLTAFELMEFEVRRSPEPPEELRNRLLGLAAYVIERGPVLKHGDTIGEDANERIKVTFERSSFGGDGRVMRLDYSRGEASRERLTTYGWIHAFGTLFCTIGFGVFLYTVVPFLRGNLLRHFLFIPAILVFGVVLLLVSDRLLQKTFGLEAFDKPKT